MRIFRIVATANRGSVAPRELLNAADQWEANLALLRDERADLAVHGSRWVASAAEAELMRRPVERVSWKQNARRAG